jgi:hypothetical protein
LCESVGVPGREDGASTVDSGDRHADAEAHAAIVANELVRNRSQTVTVSVLSQTGIVLAKAVAVA